MKWVVMFVSGAVCTTPAGAKAESPKSFEAMWRYVEAPPKTEPEASVEQNLERIARKRPEWMLRRAALLTLAERNNQKATALALSMSRDTAPRVREAVAIVLAERVSDANAAATLSVLATKDEWPLVRRAAVASMGASAAQSSLLVRIAETDPSSSVRQSVWSTFREHQTPVPIDVVKRGLLGAKSKDGALETIAYVRAMCMRSADDALLELVKKAHKGAEAASDDAVVVALSARDALHWIASAHAKDADETLGDAHKGGIKGAPYPVSLPSVASGCAQQP